MAICTFYQENTTYIFGFECTLSGIGALSFSCHTYCRLFRTCRCSLSLCVFALVYFRKTYSSTSFKSGERRERMKNENIFIRHWKLGCLHCNVSGMESEYSRLKKHCGPYGVQCVSFSRKLLLNFNSSNSFGRSIERTICRIMLHGIHITNTSYALTFRLLLWKQLF